MGARHLTEETAATQLCTKHVFTRVMHQVCLQCMLPPRLGSKSPETNKAAIRHDKDGDA